MKNSVFIIAQIIRKEFYQIRQDKRMLLVSILAPILQVVILGYAVTLDIKNTIMVVCDLDKTSVSREFVQGFTNSRYFIYKYSVNTPSEIDRFIEHSQASFGLVVPAGFGDKILKREPAPVQVFLDGTDANTANVLLGYATQILASYSQSVLPSYASIRRGPGVVFPEPRVWFNPDLKSVNFMVPGVVGLVLMIITMTLTSLGIVKEKEIGTLEQLLVTPIKPFELILGKLIPFIVIGFVDVLFVLAIARFWFEVPLTGSIPLLFGLSGLFILTTLGLGLFISTVAKSQQQAMMIAQFFFFMPFMFLSGFAIPIANMPMVIQYLTYFIPLRYFLEIVRGIFLKGTNLNELAFQACALLVIGVTTLTLSILRFRTKLE
jgi:ABC-2 type transport system permease protein